MKYFLIFLYVISGLMSLWPHQNLLAQTSRSKALKQWINDENEYQYWTKQKESVNWEKLGDVYELTQAYYKKYPKSPHAKYINAVMKGDYSELLSASEESPMKEEVVEELFEIMEVLGTVPYPYKKYLRNEYYYHSGQFLHQYLLGCEELTAGNGRGGHFSIGVGGSEHAYKLILAGDLSRARYFAEKAVIGWEEHAKEAPERAFPYPYFYLQALIISGKSAEADKFYTTLKKEERYRLKKAIYDKYDQRFKIIKKALSR